MDLLESVDIATPHIAGYSLDGKAGGSQMSVRSLSRFFGLGLKNWPENLLPVPSDNRIKHDIIDFYYFLSHPEGFWLKMVSACKAVWRLQINISYCCLQE
jgi:hypothetical protein